jgi:hypothetical protein
MPFDNEQPNYLGLRKILAERTRQVVIFCGAGLSKPAGLPSWSELRDRLVKLAKKEIQNKPESFPRNEALVTAAGYETDYWAAFKTLRRVLQDTVFVSEIREAFAEAPRRNPPQEYAELWKLPLGGFVTLNVDGFVSRGFAEAFSGSRAIREFSGIDCNRHEDLFTAGQQFVVNLHGSLAEASSWIFTSDDLENLMRIPAYRGFLATLFRARTVLFLGITADDRKRPAGVPRVRS